MTLMMTARCQSQSLASTGREQQLLTYKSQRHAWHNIVRSIAADPRQFLRVPKCGITMAEHYQGTYACRVCQCTRWQDAPGFSPLFFMQCENITCEDIVAGT
jgi:hypothetical protein